MMLAGRFALMVHSRGLTFARTAGAGPWPNARPAVFLVSAVFSVPRLSCQDGLWFAPTGQLRLQQELPSCNVGRIRRTLPSDSGRVERTRRHFETAGLQDPLASPGSTWR